MAERSSSGKSTSGENEPIQRAPAVIRGLLKYDTLRYYLQIGPWFLLLLIFVYVPLAFIVVWSFAIPTPLNMELGLSLESYIEFFTSHLLGDFFVTLVYSGLVVLLCFVVGFPIAYYTGVKKRNSKYMLPLLLLFAIPFLTSHSLRTLSYLAVLGLDGLVNQTLLALNIIDLPLEWLLYSRFAVFVGLVAAYLPFMIFPAWLGMNRIDKNVIQAASDIGATPFQIIRYIVLPLAQPGILIGAVFVFVGVLGDSVTPNILGGTQVAFVAGRISDSVGSLNYPLASAISTVIMTLALALILLWERFYGLEQIGDI